MTLTTAESSESSRKLLKLKGFSSSCPSLWHGFFASGSSDCAGPEHACRTPRSCDGDMHLLVGRNGMRCAPQRSLLLVCCSRVWRTMTMQYVFPARAPRLIKLLGALASWVWCLLKADSFPSRYGWERNPPSAGTTPSWRALSKGRAPSTNRCRAFGQSTLHKAFTNRGNLYCGIVWLKGTCSPQFRSFGARASAREPGSLGGRAAATSQGLSRAPRKDS